MESVLRGLFTGKIIPWERQAPRNESYRRTIHKIEDEERYFVEKMSLDDCGRFQALSRLYADLNALEEENIFSYGFTLGWLLARDVSREAERVCGG